VSRESSPCKSPNTGIKEQGTGLYPKEQAAELVSKYAEETGMDNQFLCWGGGGGHFSNKRKGVKPGNQQLITKKKINLKKKG